MKQFFSIRSISLWMLPLILIILYTFFRYGTLKSSLISWFSPFEGAYLVYIGWFLIGLIIDILLFLRRK
ncbi:hypothetical protein M3629_19290 [Paenibacillus polysaccharolyticus]|uniref:hypothetical protein n=1 Tax=Paenibacillus polysaccharolyticus TaxID=582692 RepID=UPI00203F139E|nr:hypothetical protein [Paenibacillus polysaccharolyticus]MCM3134928.1 hypothetical protein [Paenibacillus polysaccharolyticus]